MNSKKLLEQATAKIEKMNELMASIDVIEVTLSAATKPEAMIAFFEPSLGAIGIRYILTDNVMEDIKNTALKEVHKVRDEKAAELEQLLGIQSVPTYQETLKFIDDGHRPFPAPATQEIIDAIGKEAGIISDQVPEKRKPATINPEFEAAVQEMVKQHSSEKIEAAAEILAEDVKSLDKYPAKKNSSMPPVMTEEAVRQMYLVENKGRAEIEKYFGVSKSVLNNFLYNHKIVKPKKSAKQPEETERP